MSSITDRPTSTAPSADADLAIKLADVTRKFMRGGKPFTAVTGVNLDVCVANSSQSSVPPVAVSRRC